LRHARILWSARHKWCWREGRGEQLIDQGLVLNMGRGGELIVVVGLAFEARIAAGPGIRVISRGHDEELGVSLARAFREDARGVVSFGVAGGLSPDLVPGTCVIGSAIVSGTNRMNCVSTHDDWSKDLLQAMPGAVRGPLYGSSGPVTDPRAKAALHKTTGAIAVDMESHIVGGAAARRPRTGCPWPPSGSSPTQRRGRYLRPSWPPCGPTGP
jgi:hypothetical protein